MKAPVYAFDENTGIHRLWFRVTWPITHAESILLYKTTLGNFDFHFKKIESVYLFSIKSDWGDAVTLGKFKSCSVNNTNGNYVAFDEVSFQPEDNNQQNGKQKALIDHMVAVLESRLVAKDSRYDVEFCISSRELVVPPLVTAPPPPTLGETILENLYRDTTYGDVSFLFNNDINPPSTPVVASGSKKNGGKKGVKKSPRTQHQVITLKAHKLVLSQWPYFKAMFEGGFAESQPGEQQIGIQDTKLKTFKILLWFLYTGQLSENQEPSILYSDELEDNEDASMEDLFLAADRYDVQELRDLTAEPLLSQLNAENAIPFLFRTAYKFSELRKGVVQFVANSCGPAVPKRGIRDTYKDHPDVFDILVDLLEAYDEAQK
ncbi:hypothetical protein BGZ81_004962 [Podila clonocystis]|nr:hypothetical protein BGZ81_004962 [Podila clonocystis]